MIRRALPWGAFVAVVVVAAILAARLLVSDTRGDLYAFDSKTGALVWHDRFDGVDPVLSLAGGAVEVDATKGSGCVPGRLVRSWFDRESGGAPGPPAGAARAPKGAALVVSVERGIVRVRGKRWRGRVVDRASAGGVAAVGSEPGYVYVAVGGTWSHPCNE